MPYLNQAEMIKAEAKYYAKNNGHFGQLFYQTQLWLLSPELNFMPTDC